MQCQSEMQATSRRCTRETHCPDGRSDCALTKTETCKISSAVHPFITMQRARTGMYCRSELPGSVSRRVTRKTLRCKEVPLRAPSASVVELRGIQRRCSGSGRKEAAHECTVSVRNSESRKDLLHHIVAYTRLWQRAKGSLTAPKAQRPDSLLTRGGKRLYHSTQRAQGNPLTMEPIPSRGGTSKPRDTELTQPVADSSSIFGLKIEKKKKSTPARPKNRKKKSTGRLPGLTLGRSSEPRARASESSERARAKAECISN